MLVSALLFGNDTNPAHPKHIGSIDPACNVADVVNGEQRLHLFFSVLWFNSFLVAARLMAVCCLFCVWLSDAYEMAKMLCEQYYPTAPALKVKEFNGTHFINQIDLFVLWLINNNWMMSHVKWGRNDVWMIPRLRYGLALLVFYYFF